MLHRLLAVAIGEEPVMVPVEGVPAGAPPAWRLGAGARRALDEEDVAVGRTRRSLDRASVAVTWARHRGRVSTTELGSIVGTNPTNVNRLLQGLEDDGAIVPGRSSRTGRGFFYVPAPPVT